MFLNYWIAKGINTPLTIIWVKIPSLPAQTSVRVWLMYGNSSAPPASSLTDTFTAVIPNLLLAYDMNEGSGSTLIDKSGNARHGTIHGAQWVGGYRDYALTFDGIDDFVSFSGIDLGAPVTIVTRFMLNVPSNDNTPRVLLGLYTNLHSNVLRTIGGSSTKKLFFAHIRSTDNRQHPLITPSGLSNNTWYHAAVILDGNYNKKIYLNGSLVASATNTGAPRYPNVNKIQTIGRLHDYYFKGIVDELRIYNRELNSTEISLLQNEVPFEVAESNEAVGKTLIRKYAPQEPVIIFGSEIPIEYQGWRWARPIFIYNPNNQNLTNYEVMLTVNTQALISEGKMNANASDIRIYLGEIPHTSVVVVEPPTPPTGHLIASLPTTQSYQAMPPTLERGVTQEYEMLTIAINFAHKLASSLGRFLPESAKVERAADATGYIAAAEEISVDAILRFVSDAASALVSSKGAFGNTQVEKQVSAKGVFAGSVDEIFADIKGAFATISERYPSSLVYFGSLVERGADAKGVNIHLSDVAAIQQFLSNYFPTIWHSKEWVAIPLLLPRGTARKVKIPHLSGTNIQKGVFYLASTGNWWIENLPSDATEVIVYNMEYNQIFAIVFALRFD